MPNPARKVPLDSDTLSMATCRFIASDLCAVELAGTSPWCGWIDYCEGGRVFARDASAFASR